MKTSRTPALLIAFTLLAAGCQPASSPAAAPPSPQTGETDTTAVVDAQNIAFRPAEITVLRGTAVTWTNRDEGVRHTATSGEPGQRAVPGVQEGADAESDGLFDGDMPDAGDEFSFTFDEAGTYAYFCEIHPSMTGSVVVE